MLEMGFGEEIERIASHMSKKRQTLLFSATFPESIETLGARLLRDPLRIAVDTAPPAKIEEMYCEAKEKRKVLDRLIGHYAPQSLLIFCNTKVDTIELAKGLARQGHSVAELHGDLDQRQRQEAVIAFSNGSRRILVATDVASRGLDITGIELVINYDLPHDEAVYTHRIGRTGRADAMGRAISLVSPYETRKREAVAPHAKHKRIEQEQAKQEILLSRRETLCINGGKRQKLRPGDIVGTLAKAIGIDGKQIGDITVTETISYVALERDVIDRARRGVSTHRIKKKRYSAWILTQ
jgi:ATP-independent RNA helicase DbpA